MNWGRGTKGDTPQCAALSVNLSSEYLGKLMACHIGKEAWDWNESWVRMVALLACSQLCPDKDLPVFHYGVNSIRMGIFTTGDVFQKIIIAVRNEQSNCDDLMDPAENNKWRNRHVAQSCEGNKDALCTLWTLYHTNKLKLKGLPACGVIGVSFEVWFKIWCSWFSGKC